jgi:hypothetical protein
MVGTARQTRAFAHPTNWLDLAAGKARIGAPSPLVGEGMYGIAN